MATVVDEINDRLREFIERQHMFFVATAPLSAEGHVNLSPKGLDSFRVLSPHRVAYLDMTGSGIETAAHLNENGRITILFCAFDGPPLLLRLLGRGRVVMPNDAEWTELAALLPPSDTARLIVVADLDRIATSCGFGVPLMSFEGDRDQLPRFAASKGPEGMREYRALKNARSIDGLPAPFGE